MDVIAMIDEVKSRVVVPPTKKMKPRPVAILITSFIMKALTR